MGVDVYLFRDDLCRDDVLSFFMLVVLYDFLVLSKLIDIYFIEEKCNKIIEFLFSKGVFVNEVYDGFVYFFIYLC